MLYYIKKILFYSTNKLATNLLKIMEFDARLINDDVLPFLAATGFDYYRTFKVEHNKYYKGARYF